MRKFVSFILLKADLHVDPLAYVCQQHDAGLATGTRLLADMADTTGLTCGFCEALAGLRPPRCGHYPGRVAVDLAGMLADDGEAIADLAVLRNQPDLFVRRGRIRPRRALSMMDASMLTRLRQVHGQAREPPDHRRWNPRRAANPGVSDGR